MSLPMEDAVSPCLKSETWGTQFEDESEGDEHFDKLREECGVMAVYNHPDAARMTYMGLYALQHRGQESGGIASADGDSVYDIKGMGLVSEIFTDQDILRSGTPATRRLATRRCSMRSRSRWNRPRV